MSRYARIQDNIVAEIVMVPEGMDIADMFHAGIVGSFVACPDGVGPNWQSDGDGFAAPAAPPPLPQPVPATITPRQLLIGLMRAGIISPAEAEAAATTGAVPAAVAAVFEALPAQEAVEARITFARMGQVERDNPLLWAAMAAAGSSQADLDEFFRACAAI